MSKKVLTEVWRAYRSLRCAECGAKDGSPCQGNPHRDDRRERLVNGMADEMMKRLGAGGK